MDVDQFENTAAWLEYCDGMSRFDAETEAARRQGVKRWEAIQLCKKAQANCLGMRVSASGDNTERSGPHAHSAATQERKSAIHA